MTHQVTSDDRAFQARVERGEVAPADFDHRAHVRLAYVYLVCEPTPAEAHHAMRRAIQGFLTHHGVEPTKYHETITRAWVMAVRHFMGDTPRADSADDFIARNPRLLDSRIMLSHYSAGVLFSDEARRAFVDPDLEPIPGFPPNDAKE